MPTRQVAIGEIMEVLTRQFEAGFEAGHLQGLSDRKKVKHSIESLAFTQGAEWMLNTIQKQEGWEESFDFYHKQLKDKTNGN